MKFLSKILHSSQADRLAAIEETVSAEIRSHVMSVVNELLNEFHKFKDAAWNRISELEAKVAALSIPAAPEAGSISASDASAAMAEIAAATKALDPAAAPADAPAAEVPAQG